MIFTVDEEIRPVIVAQNEAVGIDVGIKTFAALSTGERIESPKYYRESERELKTAQRRVSRRKKGSDRRRKAVNLLAKKHQKVARKRRDFHFKEAKKLAQKYRLIKFEDLNIKGMVKNHHLAKSISDAGWLQFMAIVAFKAEEAGGRVEVVNPNGTSTRCSRCGHKCRMPLSVRTYRCGGCGLIIDRDHNAAINIKERKGRTVLSWRRRAVGAVEEAKTCRSGMGDVTHVLNSEPESPTIMRPRV